MIGATFAFSESAQAFIDEQVASGRFGSANEFVENLVEQARKHAARKELEGALLAGLNSGPGIPVTPEYWEAKKQAFIARNEFEGMLLAGLHSGGGEEVTPGYWEGLKEEWGKKYRGESAS